MTDTLEENHVHSLGDLPIFESGDLRLVDLGVQASQDGKGCFLLEYDCSKTK